MWWIASWLDKHGWKGSVSKSNFEEYLEQDSGSSISKHYDEYIDRWVDEASESVYGH